MGFHLNETHPLYGIENDSKIAESPQQREGSGYPKDSSKKNVPKDHQRKLYLLSRCSSKEIFAH
jgi:hypothetical protein